MTVPFASIVIHKFVDSVGPYVGLASLIAVVILILLYFAHARETATLRERLDEAQGRIGGLEGRIVQLMQSQRVRVPGSGVPGPVAPVPAPAGLRTANVPGAAVRRVPTPATAAAGATSGAAAAVGNRGATGAPFAPAGTGAPALASATNVIPDPVSAGDPDDTMFVPAAQVAAAATNGNSTGEHTAVLPPAKPTPAGVPVAATAAAAAAAAAPAATAGASPAAPPVPTPAAAGATSAATAVAATAAASARPPSASPRAAAVATPPRVQIGSDAEAAAATPAAGGSGGSVRRIAGNPQSSPTLPPFDDEPGGGGRLAGRVLPLLIGIVAIAVIIAGLIVITNAGNSATGNVNHNSASQTGQSLHKKHNTPIPFSAAKVTVAVLNGTAQSGLAGDVGTKLATDGYKKGNVTNAASQTEASTFVYYVTGPATSANRTAARHVAAALSLPASRVRKAGNTVLQSCKISATGASLGSCNADVIVTVGQDRVNLASSG